MVEFTGVTGVGKSTLVSHVKKKINDEGYTVYEAYEMILMVYRINFIKNPTIRTIAIDLIAVMPFLRHLFSPGGFRLVLFMIAVIRRDAESFLIGVSLFRNVVKRIGVHVLLRNLQQKNCSCDFILFDEGIIHSAHNLFVHLESRPNEDEIILFANLVPKPDKIILVTSTAEQSIECILKRGHNRAGNSFCSAKTFIEHGKFTFGVLKKVSSIRGKLFEIEHTVDNQISIFTGVNAIVEYLLTSCDRNIRPCSTLLKN